MGAGSGVLFADSSELLPVTLRMKVLDGQRASQPVVLLTIIHTLVERNAQSKILVEVLLVQTWGRSLSRVGFFFRRESEWRWSS